MVIVPLFYYNLYVLLFICIIVGMSPYVCDCTNVVYMFCVYCIYNYVNKFEARSLFSTSHLKKTTIKNECTKTHNI